MAFYMQALSVPWAMRYALSRRGQMGGAVQHWQGRIQLLAQDVSISALTCWTAYVLEPTAPRIVCGAMYASVGMAGLLAALDVMLMGEIGARLEPQLLSYSSDLTTVGGSRWHKPALQAVACGLLAAGMGWLVSGAWSQIPAAWLFALGCLCVPVAVWGRSDRAVDVWQAEGPLWRWIQIGCAALVVRLRRRPTTQGPATVCIPAQESYTPRDPAYPLWRNTQVWGGPRTVAWSMPKGHKPHVIMIVMESMGAMDTGCIGKRVGMTPCFDAWSQRGALFTRHYATGHSTSRSMMSALYGVLPGLRARPTLKISNPAYLSGLPQLFAAHGYHTRYLQGASLYFDDKESFFSERGFAQVEGAEALYALYPDAESGAWQAPHDAYLFDAHATWLLEKADAGEPTFSTLLTITNHEPWEIPRAWRPAHLADDAAYAAHMASQDPKTGRERTDLALQYADAQLGLYLDRLDKAGVLQQSLVLIVGDTGQQYEDGQVSTQVGGYLRDEAYHIPLLLLAPQYLSRPKRFEHISSQIDLPATVMDLLGWQGPHHGMGQSLVRLPQRRSAYFTQPYSPSLLSLRCEKWRMNTALNDSRESLFDLESDSHEQVNLAAAHAPRVAAFRQEARVIQDAAMRLHQLNAFAPSADARIDVPEQNLAKAIYTFAPEGVTMPQNISELQELIQSPVGTQDATLQAFQTMAARVLRAEMSSEHHLRLLQLKLQQLYVDSFGEPLGSDTDQYTDLYNMFVQAEHEQNVRVLEQVQQALQRAPKLGG